MLKLSHKRSYEDFEATHEPPVPCSPMKISFLDRTPADTPQPPAAKRVKIMDSPDATAVPRHQYFPKFEARWDTVPADKWLEWTPRHRRRHHKNNNSFVHGSHSHTEPLFSIEDLKTILQNACREMTDAQEQQYNRIMQQKLAEQFQGFTKFNEDHIHSKLKQSQYDYFG